MKVLPINALTFDVEDYYQVEAFSRFIHFDTWDQYESRVTANTNKILEILAESRVKATFFVLGWIAERFPQIVKLISTEGHEVACHGYAHKVIYKQTRQEFEEDVSKSIQILEDISGTKVVGYRAPTYSIIRETLWALEVLLKNGIQYDSSIFPIKHDRYGIPDAGRFPYVIDKGRLGSLIEFPPSTLSFWGTNIPIAGGGYLRLYPYFFLRWGLRKINQEGQPVMVYLHPWELDPDQPRINQVGHLTRFRHYVNLDKTEKKLRALMRDFRFAPAKEVLGIP
ncbi:MAG TPA: XrtA system polysaccharide deacetylase [Candidatus Limnocylindrales bacterium]|nr:XrtA system polysaccharide deacetylase [Candidatus Limnocylindrales bacterium]